MFEVKYELRVAFELFLSVASSVSSDFPTKSAEFKSINAAALFANLFFSSDVIM